MRIAYVLGLSEGGPVSHLLRLAPRVAALGSEVVVVCGDARIAGAFRAAGVGTDVLEMRGRLDLGAVARFWHRLDGFDVVHTHDRRAGLLARPPARARGAVVAHTYHGLPIELAVELGRVGPLPAYAGSRLRRAWLRQVYLRLEAELARLGVVVVPSRAMAEYLTARGISARRVRVIPSGIDVRRREPVPAHDPFVVATAAPLHFWKGIDVLVAACADVGRPVRLEVYGGGRERPALEREARRLGVDAAFHGWVDDLRQRIEHADVFVLPSRAENLPVTILEAMAAAVPVVATRVGGVPELVEDGVTGLLVEPDDPGALAVAIRSLADGPDFRASLARAGATRVAQAFDEADVARRLIALYEELRARRGTEGP